MLRPLSLAALALVAACAPPPPPELSDDLRDDLRDRYTAAIEAGDASAALAVVRRAADDGHMLAQAELVRVYTDGYLSATIDGDLVRLPIRTAPWSASLAEWRLARTVRAGVAAGHPDALLHTAEELLSPIWADGEWTSAPARRDSAAALYTRLVEVGADPLRLAFLAERLDDEPGYLAHLEAAADVGDPQACLFLRWATRDRDALFTAAALAADLDEVETCQARADDDAARPSYAEGAIADLTAEARSGNPAATATLDSLHTLGVFERHPRLAAFSGPLGG